ncbi:helix-turn-helix domain-containing protein [Methylobacterium sp. ID0610]|uniref:helix-turn-helix domain-containing protein n=1 Tax=Methylobacterium carpenticola TaxID=3344827 RepID=UPI0036BA1406
MSFETMGDQRRSTCQVHGRLDHWSRVVVERRVNGAGSHPKQAYPCNELIVMLDGRAIVRRTGDGQVESCLAGAGTAWTGPVGFLEQAELSEAIACVHVCLPPALLRHSALADYGIDPSQVELAFVGGLADPLLVSFAQAFHGLMDRPHRPTDQLFVDGLTAALAAHLIANYTIDRWKPSTAPRGLDTRRLKRVLDYIDAHFAEPISLDRLAAEACLSPFHFSRLFRKATGLTPHRYLTDRRVRAAREALALDRSSLLEIASKTGFGSQENFIRVFRKSTGLTPGEFRQLSRSGR